MRQRDKCPLCGSRAPKSTDVPFHVCEGCCEMLTPVELVTRSTRRTRRNYTGGDQ